MARQPETAIVDKILKHLRGMGAACIKHHGSAYSRAGEPDIIGCYFGKAFAIEVKVPGEGPSEIQKVRLEEWAKSGARVGVAHSQEEAMYIMLGYKTEWMTWGKAKEDSQE